MFASRSHLFGCVIFFTSAVFAGRIDDLKKEYFGYIMDCAKEYPISGSDIEMLKKKQVPESQNAKCLLACSYKKAGMMDDQGNLSVEGLNLISQKYLADNPEQIKRAEDFANACESVNDESVSDGAQGCDRAALIFKCSVEKAPEVRSYNKGLNLRAEDWLKTDLKEHGVVLPGVPLDIRKLSRCRFIK